LNTRERLTQAAVDRFYRDGFRNVGIDQILDDVGISKTAFYKHFTGKEELMLAALEMQNQWIQNGFREMIQRQGGRAAADQLRALFDVVEQVIEQEGFHGCIFVNAAIEFPLPHTPVHQLSARNKQAIYDIVHEIAGRTGAADPQQLSEELCMIIDAAYVGRVVTNRSSVIATARRLAERVIESHLGRRSGPAPLAP
jgi:AcrR family transcriptional regulator